MEILFAEWNSRILCRLDNLELLRSDSGKLGMNYGIGSEIVILAFQMIGYEV